MNTGAGGDSYMGFVGVSTGGSSIRTVFPHWAAELRLPTRTLIGHDIPLNSAPEMYRELVAEIRDDPRHRGALVTTHKMSVYGAARDLFDECDPLAQAFAEVSSIAKRGGRLVGSAKDPVTVRLALEELLEPAHFAATGGHALVLGAGGAGTALVHQLASRGDRPERIVCADRDQGRLDHTRAVLDRSGAPSGLVEHALVDGTDDVDPLVASLPPGSLVVNATGMGKDLPGSPMSDAARLPRAGVVWEFNYRGTLEFLRQARAQQAGLGLRVEDGWRYFVHGWTQVIADVFDIPMPRSTVDRLAQIASDVR